MSAEEVIKPRTDPPKQMLLKDYLDTLKERFGSKPNNWKVVCPICHTVQSVQDLLDAGVSKADVEGYFGFSCIGRFTKDKGCDWTLGGLFQLHTLEVLDERGEPHPRFEIAQLQAGV